MEISAPAAIYAETERAEQRRDRPRRDRTAPGRHPINLETEMRNHRNDATSATGLLTREIPECTEVGTQCLHHESLE